MSKPHSPESVLTIDQLHKEKNETKWIPEYLKKKKKIKKKNLGIK